MIGLCLAVQHSTAEWQSDGQTYNSLRYVRASRGKNTQSNLYASHYGFYKNDTVTHTNSSEIFHWLQSGTQVHVLYYLGVFKKKHRLAPSLKCGDAWTIAYRSGGKQARNN